MASEIEAQRDRCRRIALFASKYGSLNFYGYTRTCYKTGDQISYASYTLTLAQRMRSINNVFNSQRIHFLLI